MNIPVTRDSSRWCSLTFSAIILSCGAPWGRSSDDAHTATALDNDLAIDRMICNAPVILRRSPDVLEF